MIRFAVRKGFRSGAMGLNGGLGFYGNRFFFWAALLTMFAAANPSASPAPSDSLSLTRVARIGGLCQRGLGVQMKCHPYFLGVVASELVLVDMGNAEQPLELGRIDLGDSVLDLTHKGNFTYALVKGSGLRIIDWSRPRVPAIKGAVTSLIGAYKITSTINTVFVADGDSGVIAVDVANPAQPKAYSAFEQVGTNPVTAMDIDGNQLLVASGASGFRIYDLSSRLSPVRGSSVPSQVQDAVALPGFVYALDSGELKSFSIADPGAPRPLGSTFIFPTRRPARFSKVGETLYIGAATGGIVKLDLSDPLHPKPAATYDVADALRFQIDGGLLFVPRANGLLDILGFFAEGTLKTVATIFGGGGTFEIANGRAYLTAHEHLLIADVSHPEHPGIEASVRLPRLKTLGDVHLVGQHAMVLGSGPYNNNVGEIDVRDPKKPVLLRTIFRAEVPYSMGGDLVFAWVPGKFIGTHYTYRVQPDYMAVIGDPLLQTTRVVNSAAYRGEYFVESYHVEKEWRTTFPLRLARLKGDGNLVRCGDETVLELTRGRRQNQNGDYYLQPFFYLPERYEYHRLLAFDRNILYWATPEGIRLVDIADSCSLKMIPQAFDTSGAYTHVSFHQGSLYAVRSGFGDTLEGRVLQKLDVTDPVHPELRGNFAPGYTIKAVAQDGDYLYVSSDAYTLEIFRMGGAGTDTSSASDTGELAEECTNVSIRPVSRPTRATPSASGHVNASGRTLSRSGNGTVILKRP